MAQRIGQIRYYNDGNTRNYPAGLSKWDLQNGGPFAGKEITQLGIQTTPGVKFAINNNTSWIVVGMTGIYELNVEGLTAITGIRFEANSLSMINGNSNAYIIVDYLYEDGES